MTTTAVYLDNYCFYNTKLPEQDLLTLREYTNNIRKNLDKFKCNNSSLAGNIAREYYFDDKTVKNIERIVLPYVLSYMETNMSMIFRNKFPSTNDKIKLTSSWCNFQEKHEFNPTHDHDGFLSFVIWVNVPYTLEDERENKSVKYSNTPAAGCFEFVYCDILGTIHTHIIDCDKSKEGTLLIFPSRMKHAVYPFYTSDDYRVTISGNIDFYV